MPTFQRHKTPYGSRAQTSVEWNTEETQCKPGSKSHQHYWPRVTEQREGRIFYPFNKYKNIRKTHFPQSVPEISLSLKVS